LQIDIINEQWTVFQNHFKIQTSSVNYELLARMYKTYSNTFFTLTPFLIEGFILRNPMLKNAAGMTFDDAFSSFTLKNNQEEDENEVKKLEFIFSPLVYSMINFLTMGNIYGSVVGVLKWKNEPLNNITNPISLIKNDYLEIAYYHKYEVSYNQKENEIINDEIKFNRTLYIKGVQAHESRIFEYTTDFAISERIRSIVLDKGVSFLDIYQDAIVNFFNHILSINYFMVSKGITIISPEIGGEMTRVQSEDINATLQERDIKSDQFLTFTNPMKFDRIVDNSDVREMYRAAVLMFASVLDIPFNKFLPSETGLVGGANSENETERNWKRKIIKTQTKHKIEFDLLLNRVAELLNIDKDKYELIFEEQINKTAEQLNTENNVKLNALNAAIANGSTSSEDYLTNLSKMFPDFIFTKKDLEQDLDKLNAQDEQEGINKDEEIF
jgi:hypothetical protein